MTVKDFDGIKTGVFFATVFIVGLGASSVELSLESDDGSENEVSSDSLEPSTKSL